MTELNRNEEQLASHHPVMECADSVPGEAEAKEKGGDKEEPC